MSIVIGIRSAYGREGEGLMRGLLGFGRKVHLKTDHGVIGSRARVRRQWAASLRADLTTYHVRLDPLCVVDHNAIISQCAAGIGPVMCLAIELRCEHRAGVKPPSNARSAGRRATRTQPARALPSMGEVIRDPWCEPFWGATDRGMFHPDKHVSLRAGSVNQNRSCYCAGLLRSPLKAKLVDPIGIPILADGAGRSGGGNAPDHPCSFELGVVQNVHGNESFPPRSKDAKNSLWLRSSLDGCLDRLERSLVQSGDLTEYGRSHSLVDVGVRKPSA